MEETFDDENNCVALEVKGFYFGEPNDSATKTFYNDLKAEFTD
jgi:hypothetical protein